MARLFFVIFTVFFLMVSCNKKSQNQTSEKKNEVKKEIKKEVKKETSKVKKETHKPDQKEIKAENYEVNFNFKDELNSTEDFIFEIKALPKNHKHINTGFPVSLKFDEGCFKFEKAKFKAKDAKTMTEKELVFSLKSKCDKKGEQILSGNLKFGYCSEEMCYTYNAPFKFKINVK